MKLLIAIAWLVFWNKPAPSLLVLDKDLKKPIQQAAAFTTEQYLQRSFPVYAAEAEAIIHATDKIVRQMDKNTSGPFYNTISTPHSTFLLSKHVEEGQTISVILITKIEEISTSFSFVIVEKETDKRKAQQKLLDFATYLAQ